MTKPEQRTPGRFARSLGERSQQFATSKCYKRDIAEPADDAMTQLEGKMTAAEALARNTLTALGPLLPSDARTRMQDAQASLDSFLDLNRQLLTLSRRNSNVRSLALTLGEKRRLTAQCEDSLRALSEALGKRGFVATR